MGHPKVWYEMGDEDFVECKYCDRRFVLIGGREDPSRPSKPAYFKEWSRQDAC